MTFGRNERSEARHHGAVRRAKVVIIAAPGAKPLGAPRQPLLKNDMPAHAPDRTETPLSEDEATPTLSKTKRKQAMAELQELGTALLTVPPERLQRIELPDELREAIRAAQRMPRQDEAKRRQVQYIGRLMRGVEPEPIRAAIAAAQGNSSAETARLHRIERLRDTLLADEAAALRDITARYPGIDLQHLRTLRRAALKEKEQARPPRSYRAIFQVLNAADQAARPEGERASAALEGASPTFGAADSV